MKRISISVLLMIAILVFANDSYPETTAGSKRQGVVSRKTVLGSFERKVDRFREFFSRFPKVLHDRESSASETGRLIWFEKCKLISIEYNVRKTDSLVSPFTGSIQVTYCSYDNTKCGDVKGRFKKRGPIQLTKNVDGAYVFNSTETDVETTYGYSTLDSAKNGDVANCYEKATWPIYKATFNFAFQNGRWVFKNISSDANIVIDSFSNAMGLGSYIHRYSSENDVWRKLAQ